MGGWVLGKSSNNKFDFRSLSLRHLLATEDHKDMMFGMKDIGEEIVHGLGLCLFYAGHFLSHRA